MKFFRIWFYVIGAVLLAGCSFFAPVEKIESYSGPKVTKILVYKQDRQMFLMNGDEVLKKYAFELGFGPTGHKQVVGDGKTPEGDYYIDRKNPNSQFYLSIGISYPNAQDRAHAASLGKSAGGDIFIHGTHFWELFKNDWTWGCIAVTNAEMREIYSMIKIGTPITIYP